MTTVKAPKVVALMDLVDGELHLSQTIAAIRSQRPALHGLRQIRLIPLPIIGGLRSGHGFEKTVAWPCLRTP
jgi:hypothetical protein